MNFALNLLHGISNQVYWDARNEAALNAAMSVRELMLDDSTLDTQPRWIIKRTIDYKTTYYNEDGWSEHRANAKVYTQSEHEYPYFYMPENGVWEKIS